MREKPKNEIAEQVANFWDWWERGRSLVQQIGPLRSLLVGALNLAWVWAAWFWNNVSWYIAFTLFLIGAASSLIFIHKIQVIRATAKFNPRDYEKFGKELVELSQEIFRFLADRQRDHSELHRANPRGDASAAYDTWQADRDFEAVTGKLFFERFGPRVMGSLALLQRIGITMPPHMIFSAQSRPNGLPQFLGAIGELLARGNIADAIAISNDREFMWQIAH